jgi:hypothetical protein
LVLITAAGLLVAFVVAGLPLYVFPAQTAPHRSDVVMVIGPADPWRIAWGEQLVASGTAGELVISVAGLHPLPPVCRDRGVLCFHPVPSTTQGEARELARLMKQHHWTTATVITVTPHIARTRLRMSSCVPRGVQVVGRPIGLTFDRWVYQYLYQTAGFLKAFLVTPGC